MSRSAILCVVLLGLVAIASTSCKSEEEKRKEAIASLVEGIEDCSGEPGPSEEFVDVLCGYGVDPEVYVRKVEPRLKAKCPEFAKLGVKHVIVTYKETHRSTIKCESN